MQALKEAERNLSLWQRPNIPLLFLIFYAIVVLFIGIKYHRIGTYGVETDFYWPYAPDAREILKGHFVIEDYHGPAYSTILALGSIVTNDLFHLGMVFSTIFSSLVLVLIFRMVRRLYTEKIALVTTILIAVNPLFFQLSYTPGTDMLFNLLVTGCVFFLLMKRSILLSALFAAAAFLTRFNGLFLLAGVPLLLVLFNPYEQSLRDRVKSSLLFAGLFIAFISPWGFYCLSEKGSFFYSKNYLNMGYEVLAKGRITWDEWWYREANKYQSFGQVIAADPMLFLKTIFRNLHQHFRFDLEQLVGWKIAIFSIAGMAILLWKRKFTRQQLAFYFFGALFFGSLLFVYHRARYSMFLLPFYVLPAAGLTQMSLRSVRFALLSILLISGIWGCYRYNKERIASGPMEILKVAEGFARTGYSAMPGDIIMSRKPHISYYLGMKIAPFPYLQSMEDLKQGLRKANASYLYYSESEGWLRPEYWPLLDPARAPEWLHSVVTTDSPRAVLYKVKLK